MNKILLLIFAIVCSAACVNAQAARHTPPVDGSKYVEIDDADHNFGNIVYGKAVSYSVKMKNISEDTLMLTNVIVSCGCTTPQYKTGVYPPGAEIDMSVGFNGHTKGDFNKTMSVLFQDNKAGQIVKILRFRGTGIMPTETGN